MIKILFQMLIPILFTGVAMAGKASEGGEKYCMQFSNIAGKIANDLLAIGNEKVQKIVPGIDVNEFWERKKVMSCVPVIFLDRTAKSYPSSNQVELLVNDSIEISSWNELSRMEKHKLVIHELNVLAGYELDGEYFLSEKLFEVLMKELTQEYSILKMKGSEVSLDKIKKTVTVISPFFGSSNNVSSLSQYCQYFNLRDLGMYETEPNRWGGAMIVLHENGGYHYSDSPGFKIKSVTCGLD
ncbi:MAG: hypothetical protein VX642_02645 [Bdellovibrionota bacterium]|nr:hypothetical protein [Bdellovibrionota bacterium]